MLRVSSRFFILSILAWSLLAAIGWMSLQRKTNRLWMAFVLAILLDYSWGKYPIQSLRFSPGYTRMSLDPIKGAVLDLPNQSDPHQVANMPSQTIHKRAIVGGYLATITRLPEDDFRNESAMLDLLGLDPPLRHPIATERLRELGFAFIVLHRDRATGLARMPDPLPDPTDLYHIKIMKRRSGMPANTWRRIRAELKMKLGTPYFEDDDITVFRLD